MSNTKKWHFAGAIFTIVIGTLLHFVYGWSGGRIAALFNPVNESVWEHLKQVFWPMLLFAVAEYFLYGKKYKNFVPVKVLSLLTAMITVVVLFYTYTGITGKDSVWVDILIFIVAVILAYYFSYKNLSSGEKFNSVTVKIASWILLSAMILTFIVFTYNPPELPIFLDPVSGNYGISE